MNPLLKKTEHLEAIQKEKNAILNNYLFFFLLKNKDKNISPIPTSIMAKSRGIAVPMRQTVVLQLIGQGTPIK